ncbi:MAG: phosphatidylserine decarboxylase family protein, partial [Planctomycetaceae bacterium]
MTQRDLTTERPGPATTPAEDSPKIRRLLLEPMDPQLTSIQPGGGVVMRLELAWGRLRRAYLRTFRRGYVERMRQIRCGERNGCPHDVLDPRDLKFHRNQAGHFWEIEHDPFRWRDRLPFARAGLAELIIFSLLIFGSAAALAIVLLAFDAAGVPAWTGWAVVTALVVVGLLIAWFFRNPPRRIPTGEQIVVSPADGTVTTIEEIEHDEFIGGPAVLIGIFLSIFNVHINRSPTSARVIGLGYTRGKFLNALLPESSRENEQLAVRLEGEALPHRRMIVRQITGQIARRIVCRLKPGDLLETGEQFGMIKFGSRTELVLPREEGLRLAVEIGHKVKAGVTLLAEYEPRDQHE